EGHRPSATSSLLLALPLILGERLEPAIRDALVVMAEAHLTEFGPATELVDSPHYEADGYWRGPIWAPSTFILEAGLRRSGRPELADDVRSRFRRPEADGYWRGPIWAPSTFILEAGLRRSGRPELADDVRSRFRRLCERHGFAENFDALTGSGLRDRAYTWTAAVYLLFARAR